MQQKLFDDIEQLQLPEELMTYTPGFISREEGNKLLKLLLDTVPWQQHKEIMYDKEVITPRLSAWYGDKRKRDEGKREALPWLSELDDLRQRIEQHTGVSFQGVLLNYYRDGNDSVAWHADKDTMPGLKTDIASVSIGEERNFDFRNKDDHRKKYSIKLEHGSLLLMKAELQKGWEHRIAKSIMPMNARINMTFRKVMD
ncbi:alpha-ketoglutarate-dependent dioxygenase AlkB family protein [Niabella hibiscisoli]|uniref:alpha-ketoglutarate-dependent dioxygenase AlkB family protein n=1 Tax=Niabella hibiscisoli TaxID=1825928 RepID=UPI001F0FDF24|nr:alpha-ketoglutarate-dependent dioxygenase AlkB [Niabella hibiscisoli]MCH5717836.1 alpha-ketoglutarate-dependent dioxygenase AlkB [Niabella hibiscisoli]